MGTVLENYPRYTISVRGAIWDTKLDRRVATQVNEDGYLKTTLRDTDNKRKGLYIHRLLALTFIPNPENKDTVNHIDGDKLNNTLSNLEWATRSEQVQHAWDTGLIQNLAARKAGIRKHQGKPVTCITTGETWNSIGAAAEELGLQKSNISAVCLGKKGYKSAGKTPCGAKRIWRFTDE